MTDLRDEYAARLKVRCEAWEAKPGNAVKAAELRLVAQRKLGMGLKGPRSTVAQLVLDRVYHEEVRKLHPKWPSEDEFVKTGASGA